MASPVVLTAELISSVFVVIKSPRCRPNLESTGIKILKRQCFSRTSQAGPIGNKLIEQGGFIRITDTYCPHCAMNAESPEQIRITGKSLCPGSDHRSHARPGLDGPHHGRSTSSPDPPRSPGRFR